MKISANEHIATRTKTGMNTSELIQAEMFEGAICSLNIAGVLVALWRSACSVGGMIVSGGPSCLLKGGSLP